MKMFENDLGPAQQCVRSGKWMMRVACVGAAVAFCSTDAAYGQSFLEKLESVVRDKLNNQPAESKPAELKPSESKPAQPKPPIPKPPQSNPANVVPSPSEVGEELPAPRREPNMPSILDRDRNAPTRGSQELQLSPATKEPVDADSNEPPPVYLGLEVEELVGGGIGVRVAKLTDNSPAWKAGFKAGDLLQAIDGHAIADLDGMAERLRRVMPGKPTKFLVKRAGRNLELTAVLQSAALAERLGNSADPMDGPAFLGVNASDLTPAFRSQFGLAVFSGAAVTNVARESPAYAAGIRPGDAIVEVNGTPIDSADALLSWIGGAQIGQPAELMVYRGTQASMKSLVLSSAPTPADMIDRNRPAPRSQPGFAPATQRADSLQAEVEQLRDELAQTQQQLIQTQRRLDQVLQQLERNQ